MSGFAEPENRGCHEEFSQPVDGSFGVAGREVAELLEPAEAALDDVAARVLLGVELWWAATAGAFREAAGAVVGLLRAW